MTRKLREFVVVPGAERVALLLESDGPGGAEVMLLNLAEALRARGHVVTPVGPANGCGWLAGEFRARGFEPEVFRLRRPLDPKCATELASLFRRLRIQVAHSHEFTMAVYGAAAARMAGIGHIVTMHGDTGVTAVWRRRAALRWSFRRSEAVVAVSKALRESLRASLGSTSPMEVIYNGVPYVPGTRDTVRRELGLDDNELLIMAVGNLYPVKGHAILLRALVGLGRERPDMRWRVAIAGKDTYDGVNKAEGGALRAFAAEHGFADRLHLLGHRTDVPDLLAAADVFVMPSLSEGLPLALLEAMFAGKPVVASDVGGIPEVITHDANGILCPVGDADAFTRALVRLADSEDVRKAFGELAAARAREAFGVDAMTGAYQGLYARAAAMRASISRLPRLLQQTALRAIR